MSMETWFPNKSCDNRETICSSSIFPKIGVKVPSKVYLLSMGRFHPWKWLKTMATKLPSSASAICTQGAWISSEGSKMQLERKLLWTNFIAALEDISTSTSRRVRWSSNRNLSKILNRENELHYLSKTSLRIFNIMILRVCLANMAKYNFCKSRVGMFSSAISTHSLPEMRNKIWTECPYMANSWTLTSSKLMMRDMAQKFHTKKNNNSYNCNKPKWWSSNVSSRSKWCTKLNCKCNKCKFNINRCTQLCFNNNKKL